MSNILSKTEGGIRTIRFNRVEKKNSLTGEMYTSLADILQQAQADESVRVVLIEGDEAIFTAGNDLGDFLNNPRTEGETPVGRFLNILSQFPKPVVAAVCGPAVGIGTTMLFHCDLIYAGENAIFSMPFVNLGLCPEAASSLLAPQMFGYHRAAEALLLGEPMAADVALDLGLVNRVVPTSEVSELARQQAIKLAAKPLSSLMVTKRLMKVGQQSFVLAQMKEERGVFGRLLGEPAAREAFSAFLEKRKPDFSKA